MRNKDKSSKKGKYFLLGPTRLLVAVITENDYNVCLASIDKNTRNPNAGYCTYPKEYTKGWEEVEWVDE